EVEAVVAAVPPDAARLHAAERRWQVPDVVRVDPHHADVQSLSEPVGPGRVLRPHVRCQAVVDVVGYVQRLLLVPKRDRGEDGAEYLLAGDTHGRPGIAEERGPHVEAPEPGVRATAGGHQGALADREVEVRGDLRQMVGVDERAHLGRGVERVPDDDARGAVRQRGRELVVYGVLYEDAAARSAALAVEAVDHEADGVQRTLQVRVVEHHGRVLTTQLEVDAFEGGGALGHDLRPGRALADERYRLDVGVLGERPACRLAEAVDDVQHAGRQARLQRELSQTSARQRRPLRRLVHDRATCGKRGRDLPGQIGRAHV